MIMLVTSGIAPMFASLPLLLPAALALPRVSAPTMVPAPWVCSVLSLPLVSTLVMLSPSLLPAVLTLPLAPTPSMLSAP